MRKKFIVSFIFFSQTLLMSAGCATTGKLEARLQARVGQNINDVIDQIGPPAQTFKKPDGDTVYTWENKGPTRATASNYYGKNHVDIQDNYCNINYTAGSDGIIKRWQHQGNICRLY